MKTAAKLFTIIGIVVNFWTIVAPIVGILALNKMKKATCKSDLTVMAVLNLIFCNLIGGILMLLLKDEDFAPAE
ncbi:MAG: hypothetical protein IJ344_04870 [Clostridia bacterium]|nr:hypothetical protein [Clostridia bacterium]